MKSIISSLLALPAMVWMTLAGATLWISAYYSLQGNVFPSIAIQGIWMLGYAAKQFLSESESSAAGTPGGRSVPIGS